MSQPGAVKIILPRKENLRLRLEFAEGMRMDDAVAVSLERAAVIRLARAAKRFGIERIVKPVFHKVDFESNGRLAGMQTLTISMPATHFDTTVGPMGISWSGAAITGFTFVGGKLPPSVTPEPWVAAIIDRVHAHLGGIFQDFTTLPYAFAEVGDFQRQVYRQTLTIKAGSTCSYGDIARHIGHPPGASRAVGVALGANPWPLLVPCHRVVAADGKMTGFSGAGGIKTKLRLLALEGAQLFAE
jgi:methylated-DNA-[protein]-cysteine S-methyltransferase